jgi:3-deoxy-manno-octulosonate cytidylyltransferase (CMP-KDO synthetase)
MLSPKSVAIIPARMAATRLPGKPLLDLCGKPIIQWVYERASQAELVDRVLVATPDAEIMRAVEAFGGTAVMTSPDHRSGTDRLAEVAAGIEDGIVVNVQGDEPLIEPAAIDSLISAFGVRKDLGMASLMRRIRPEEAQDPNLVKVVTDRQGFALYFSRSPIPFVRRRENQPPIYGHIGLYAYTREILLGLSALSPTQLEMAESLEQLRALENGYRILMIETEFAPVGVDTLEDLEAVRKLVSYC